MSKIITTHLTLNAPVEDVWETLTDLAGYRTWNPLITTATGTITVGNRLNLTIQPPGSRAMAFSPWVTAVERHHYVEWLGRLALPAIFDGRHSFTLTSLAGGRTLLQQSETFTGVMIPFSGSILARTRAGFVAMNEALQQHTSRSAPPILGGPSAHASLLNRDPNIGAASGDGSTRPERQVAQFAPRGSPMIPTEEPKVRLVLLDEDVLELLVRGDFQEAGRAFQQPIPAAFAEDDWLWRMRLEDLRAAPESHPWLVRAIVSPDRGIVGHAGFHGPPNASGEATVAYSVVPSERGRGFAKAALGELLGLAANGGARAAVATISPDNHASLAVIRAFDFEPRGDQRDEDDELELIFVCSLPAKRPGHP